MKKRTGILLISALITTPLLSQNFNKPGNTKAPTGVSNEKEKTGKDKIGNKNPDKPVYQGTKRTGVTIRSKVGTTQRKFLEKQGVVFGGEHTFAYRVLDAKTGKVYFSHDKRIKTNAGSYMLGFSSVSFKIEPDATIKVYIISRGKKGYYFYGESAVFKTEKYSAIYADFKVGKAGRPDWFKDDLPLATGKAISLDWGKKKKKPASESITVYTFCRLKNTNFEKVTGKKPGPPSGYGVSWYVLDANSDTTVYYTAKGRFGYYGDTYSSTWYKKKVPVPEKKAIRVFAILSEKSSGKVLAHGSLRFEDFDKKGMRYLSFDTAGAPQFIKNFKKK